MKLVVIDSSVTVKWINQIDEKLLNKADKLLLDAQAGFVQLMAPELSKYEVGNALVKKNLDLQQAYASLATIYQLPIVFVPETEELGKETYHIAHEARITYYDASFLALAKQINATLVTDNPKHHGKLTDAFVVALEDY